MNRDFQKLALFGAVISLLTSMYVTFLATWLQYGPGPGFVLHWFKLIPKAYLAVLPFVLIFGPLVRRAVDKWFDKRSGTNAKT